MDRVFRSWSALTKTDVQNIADKTRPEDYSKGWYGDRIYMPEYTSDLNGKEITLEFENRRWHYHFIESRKLRWNAEGEKETEAICNIHQAPDEPGMYFVQHYCPGSRPPTAHTLILDFNTGRATMVIAKIGIPECAMQVQREFLFGVIKGFNVSGLPHCFTDDLVGTAIIWTYDEPGPKVKHIYSSPYYYTYTGYFRGIWMASNPADYVKINDHMYIFSMVEERQTGAQGLFLINMNTLHDVGSFFGCHATGLECYTVGAKGELSSMATSEEEYRLMASL